MEEREMMRNFFIQTISTLNVLVLLIFKQFSIYFLETVDDGYSMLFVQAVLQMKDNVICFSSREAQNTARWKRFVFITRWKQVKLSGIVGLSKVWCVLVACILVLWDGCIN